MYRAQSGMSLIEVSLAFTLSTIIALMLYKTFLTSQKSSEMIRQTNTIQTTKTLVHYHMQRDFSDLLLPFPASTWYETASALAKKKPQENEKPQVAATHPEAHGEQQQAPKDDKKKQEKMQKKIDALTLFLPTQKKADDGSITITLITANSTLTKQTHPCRTQVIYRFAPLKDKKTHYCLYRSETPFSFPSNAKTKESPQPEKKPKEYALIEELEDLEITWYMPKIDVKEFAKKKPEEIEQFLIDWHEKPVFETKKELAAVTPDTFFEQPIMPYACTITGTILFPQGVKKTPFTFMFTYPHAYYTLHTWALSLAKKQQKEKKEEEKEPKQPGEPGGDGGAGKQDGKGDKNKTPEKGTQSGDKK